MKRKSDSSQVITKDFLKNKLDALGQKIDDKVHGEINSLRAENKQYKDEVLSKLDNISGQLGELRDENTIGSYQTSQLKEQVDSHEERIASLEKSQHAI